jgi:hypothetical protein
MRQAWEVCNPQSPGHCKPLICRPYVHAFSQWSSALMSEHNETHDAPETAITTFLEELDSVAVLGLLLEACSLVATAVVKTLIRHVAD